MSTTDMVEYRKIYYEKNKEKMLVASKEYYQKNKDKCKAAVVANKLKHFEQDPNYYKKANAKYYIKHKEYYKEYYQKNRVEIIARQRKKKNNKTIAANKKTSSVAVKQALIESNLANLLVKKEAFKKKLADEAAEKNSGLNPLP
tara:strand:+ start:233 stop:664 length:432 start_codon:yes stop_codon:yes gene_type:complete